MRTVRSLQYAPDRDPLDWNPFGQRPSLNTDPPGQRSPWTENPPGQRPAQRETPVPETPQTEPSLVMWPVVHAGTENPPSPWTEFLTHASRLWKMKMKKWKTQTQVLHNVKP